MPKLQQERDSGSDLVLNSCVQAIQLSEFMLGCMARPERAVAEIAIDYFITLNSVALAQRAAELQVRSHTRLNVSKRVV